MWPEHTSHFALVHVDAALIVVNKAAGVLSVPGRGAHKADSVATRVAQCWPDARVLHRLDQDTSGLLVFARGDAHAKALAHQFRHRLIEKTYTALVHGRLWPERGSIDLPLHSDWLQRPLQRVLSEPDGGKPSLSHWQVLRYDAASNISRIALQPHTGRTHQLRVHLLAIGHPLVGDSLYHAASAPRLMLHASEIRLNHPLLNTAQSYTATAAF